MSLPQIPGGHKNDQTRFQERPQPAHQLHHSNSREGRGWLYPSPHIPISRSSVCPMCNSSKGLEKCNKRGVTWIYTREIRGHGSDQLKTKLLKLLKTCGSFFKKRESKQQTSIKFFKVFFCFHYHRWTPASSNVTTQTLLYHPDSCSPHCDAYIVYKSIQTVG